MNDQEILERFRADVAPIDQATLARGRQRLLAEATRTATPAITHNVRTLWTRGRLVAVGAAVLVLAIIVVGNQAPHSGVPSQPIAAPDLSARGVLQQAALVAFRTPAATVRSDQFIYVESLAQFDMGFPDGNGGSVMRPTPQVRRLAWLSADGRHDGLVREYPVSGGVPNVFTVRACSVMPSPGYDCTPIPAYRGDLPTTTEAMREFLYTQPPTPDGPPPDAQAFMTVANLVGEALIPPAALSALFSATADIPGVTVAQDMVDAAGRHGIVVGRTYHGQRQELIFDRQTFTYLGTREVTTEAIYGLAVGTVIGFTAALRVAVVDRPGQQP